jgi:hypothetical protein
MASINALTRQAQLTAPIEKESMEVPKFHTSKNGIRYTNKKAIYGEGKIIGWWLYDSWLSRLGGSKFVGYMWRTKTGNA